MNGPLDTSFSYQRHVIQLIFYLSIPTILFFAALNILHNHFILGLAEIMLAFCFLLCLAFFLKRSHIEQIKRFLLLSGYVIFLLLFIDGGIDKSGLYWSMLFPPLVFALFSLEQSRRHVLSFACILLLLSLLHFIYTPYLAYSPLTLLLAAVMYGFFSSLAYIFASHQQQESHRIAASNQQLNQIRLQLEQSQQHLEQEVQQRTASLVETTRQLEKEVQQKEEFHQAWKKSQQQLIQAQKMEAMGTMVGRIAHDFNNILAAMMGSVYLLKKGADSREKTEKRLQLMNRELERATAMINKLMVFAHPESGELKPINIGQALQEFMEVAELPVKENIRFEIHIDLPPETLVSADIAQLEQVIINIVNNAVHAVQDVSNPGIYIHAHIVDRNRQTLLQQFFAPDIRNILHLSIRDNGCGIPDDQINAIFDPFFTTKTAGEGTGLGLSMAHIAIRNHGGFIDVDSSPQHGSTFHIYLPILERTSKQVSTAETTEVVDGQGENILLVDDNQFLLHTHADLLRSIGYHVTMANSGKQALEIIEKQGDQIDAMIFDIVMPELSGPETINILAEKGFHRPTLFVTGYDLGHRLDHLPKNMELRVLQKPLNVPELSQEIANLLRPSAETE